MAEATVDKSPERTRAERLRHLLVVVLTINSGATDAIGFVALGGVFTSVMTGNMVLLGVSVGERDADLARSSIAAIACFVLGAGIGAKIAHLPRPDDPVWPRAVSRALTVELGIYLLWALGWLLTKGRPEGWLQLGLLVVLAAGLGVQSSAIQRFGVSGLSTTYLTGTLTSVVIRLMTGHKLGHVMDSVQILLGLIVGAALGAFLTLVASPAAVALQLLCVAGVLLTAHLRFTKRGSSPRLETG